MHICLTCFSEVVDESLVFNLTHGYTQFCCNACNHYTCKCDECGKTYHGGSRRTLKQSIDQILHHIDANHNQDANEDDDVPDLTIRETMLMSDTNKEDELYETRYLDELCDESFSVDIDYDKNSSILEELFTRPKLVLDGHLYSNFGSTSTNEFMIQDFTLFHQENCKFGGLRCFSWGGGLVVIWTYSRIKTRAILKIQNL
jgi:hypothetical protein